MLEQQLLDALQEVIKDAGSEPKLSGKSGVTQSNINKIKNKKVDIDNLQLGTLRKLFPNMRIDFMGTGGRIGYTAEIVKMLNRLSETEQLQIMLAIAANFPQSTDDKVKNFIKKLRE